MPDPATRPAPAAPPATGRSPARLVAESLRDDLREGGLAFAANTVAGSVLVPRVVRLLVYRALGMDVGRANVRSGVTFTTSQVSLGWDAMVNRGCTFDNSARVTLGARVRVGPEVMFCTSTHELGDASQRAGARVDRPIVVGDGCWIGTRAVLLPGVVVGAGCVIAAGAVVTDDCAPNGLYAGVPAKRIRDLPA